MKTVRNIALVAILMLILGACSGATETVEVTRIVTESVVETVVEEVEVTRIVEGEVVTEMVDVEDQYSYGDMSVSLGVANYICHFGIIAPLGLFFL